MNKELTPLKALRKIKGYTISIFEKEVNELSREVEQELKALEIIERKQVNVEYLIEVVKQFQLTHKDKVSLWCITEREEDKKEEFKTELELYNRTCMYRCNYLTQEEYELLKEVLL